MHSAGLQNEIMTTRISSPIKNICIYCGSSEGHDPDFMQAATKLGELIALNNMGLVYGGGNNGLMGAVARSVLTHGGRVTGIIPTFLKNKENMLTSVDELIVVPDMHTRKMTMFEKADAFIALPGGIGTLEELVEQITWAQLGRHRKPVLLFDQKGFWRPLLDLITHMRAHGFIRSGLDVRYMVAEKVEDIVPMLTQAANHAAREGAPTDLQVHGL
jgi:uncharacterized protein (TIGR00730 family)